MSKIVGIGGVSNSGKSQLAEMIKSNLPNKLVSVICQDDYIHPQYEIPKIQNHINWESPESINFVAYRNAIVEASDVSDLIVAEGFLAFYDPGINALYDKKIIVQISREEFYKRKRNDLRWGKEPEWYIDHIWRSYLRIGKPVFQPQEYLLFDGSKEFDLNQIFSFLDLH